MKKLSVKLLMLAALAIAAPALKSCKNGEVKLSAQDSANIASAYKSSHTKKAVRLIPVECDKADFDNCKLAFEAAHTNCQQNGKKVLAVAYDAEVLTDWINTKYKEGADSFKVEFGVVTQKLYDYIKNDLAINPATNKIEVGKLTTFIVAYKNGNILNTANPACFDVGSLQP
jgi:hypothetical protein